MNTLVVAHEMTSDIIHRIKLCSKMPVAYSSHFALQYLTFISSPINHQPAIVLVHSIRYST